MRRDRGPDLARLPYIGFEGEPLVGMDAEARLLTLTDGPTAGHVPQHIVVEPADAWQLSQ